MIRNSIKKVWRNQIWIVFNIALLSCVIGTGFLNGDELTARQEEITAEKASEMPQGSDSQAGTGSCAMLSDMQDPITAEIAELGHRGNIPQTFIGGLSMQWEPEEDAVSNESAEYENMEYSEENVNLENVEESIPDNSNKPKVNTAEENPEAIDVLVNRIHVLPASYAPSNLVVPDVSFSPRANYRLLREEAAAALEEMFRHALKAGHKLYVQSGYRSYNDQKAIFQSNVRKRGSVKKASRISANAGESEHQTGLAVDITSKSVKYKLTTSFGRTAEGKWAAENAHKYGFIIRFPKGKEDITGFMYEPWHLRYLGVELATEVYKSGLTYEEFLDQSMDQ